MNIKTYKLLFMTLLLIFAGMSRASVFVNSPPNIFLGITEITQTNNNSIDVSIGISGLTSGVAPSLSTYDIDLEFDSTYLSYSSALLGDSVLGNQLDLSNLGSNPSSSLLTSPGVLNLYELSFDSVADLNDLQADSFTLATVTFNVLKAGTSQLGLVGNTFGDADGNALSVIAISSVPVTTVPLPSAFFMMLPGVASLLVSAKKPKSVG